MSSGRHARAGKITSVKEVRQNSKNKYLLCLMGKTYTSIQFMMHLFRARRWDAFHSPYLFDLFTYCCDENNGSPKFERIEQHRNYLLTSCEQIARLDYGAGSVAGQAMQVSGLARNALSQPFQCRFLFRLVNFLKPQSVLELGTSFGISTAYLSAGSISSEIDTVEGDPEIAAFAEKTFEALDCQNISLYVTRFQDYIDLHLTEKGTIDLLFIDGHHTGQALLHYYDAIKHTFHSDTVLVVDDIYWSEDMQAGWNELISYPEVTQSVDCFHFGLIFFSNNFIGLENHKIRLPIRMMLTKN